MIATKEVTPVLADSLESRRYNRVKRWLGVADFAIGLGLLVVLLATGWTGTLRDLAERGASQNYPLAVFLYVLMLILISKVIGTPIEYYGFRLEHRYNLSNQRFRSWLWDEFKGLLIALVMATIVFELLYWLLRHMPDNWWLIAWAVFLAFLLCNHRSQSAVESFDGLWLAAGFLGVESFAGSWVQSVGESADGGDGFLEFHSSASARSMAEKRTGSL